MELIETSSPAKKFTPTHYFMFNEDSSLVAVALMRNVQTHEVTVMCAECDKNFNKTGVISKRVLRETDSNHISKCYFMYKDKRIYTSWLNPIPH